MPSLFIRHNRSPYTWQSDFFSVLSFPACRWEAAYPQRWILQGAWCLDSFLVSSDCSSHAFLPASPCVRGECCLAMLVLTKTPNIIWILSQSREPFGQERGAQHDVSAGHPYRWTSLCILLWARRICSLISSFHRTQRITFSLESFSTK